MQTVSDVMSRNAQVVFPHETLQRAAQLMAELDVGALPVCDGDRLVGMVTDRDITVRGSAAGKLPGAAQITDVMSTNVRWCFEDQPLDDVMIQMADSQVRRIPVVSHDDAKRLVGIVTLGDVAIKTREGEQKEDVEDLVEIVSEPTGGGGASATNIAGADLPSAGQGEIGVAGGSGQPRGGQAT